MKRIKLEVAYDGTNYCGWQIQPKDITIEKVLNDNLTQLLGEEIKVPSFCIRSAGCGKDERSSPLFSRRTLFYQHVQQPCPGDFLCPRNLLL